MNKKVSIIIPCYNFGNYIEEAIESAVCQTYKNIEIICVNDASKDNSAEIIQKLADKYENVIFYNFKENQGVVKVRNFAIEKSSGEYILPLDGDDILEPTCVEKAVEILDNRPDIGIVYGEVRIFGVKNKIWDLPKYNREHPYEICIPNTSLFRKEDFIKAGRYKENMKDGAEDSDLWLSIIELGLNPYQISEISYNYRRLEDSRSVQQIGPKTGWMNEIIRNHIDFFLTDKTFGEKLFYDPKPLEKKLKKYKKISKITSIIALLELLIILFASFYLIKFI